jgi:YaiO family outer membrane protein
MNKPATAISRIFLLLFLFTSCFCAPLQAQKKKVDVDELYATARKAAFDDKDYNKALELCNQALAIAPQYTDIIIFKASIFGWTNQPDSARANFNLAIQQKPKLMDVYVAYANFEYQKSNYELAMKIIETGLQHNQQHPGLLIVKAKVLEAQENYTASMDAIETVLDNEPRNTEARTLQQRIKDKVSKNAIGLKYDYVYFDTQYPNPWHFAALTYTRQTSLGSVTFNVNYANRFKQSDLQYEIEAYPHISKTFYGYVNLAYSDEVGTFANWRGGISLWANLPKSFEAEAGTRFVTFASTTVFYTLYAGKYYGNFLFGARTYVTPDTLASRSFVATTRYYYGAADQYIGANIGFGISPDDDALSNAANVQVAGRLKAFKAGVDLKHSFNRMNIISFNLSYINQEFVKGNEKVKGNQIQVGVGYVRKF